MDTKKLRQKILDLAIRGKLVPQNPSDEPASVLLKRIQEEKERLIKEGKIKRNKKENTDSKSHYQKSIKNEDIPFEIPNSWVWQRILDISNSIQYGYTGSAILKGKYKMLRITDIQDNSVDWKYVPFVEIDDKRAENYLLSNDDIVFARTGATVGKSFLIRNLTDKSVFASYLIRIQLKEKLNAQYVKYFFESGYYWEQIEDKSVGTGQPNVNGTLLGELFISLPPLAEQKRIAQKIEQCFTFIDQIEENKLSLSQFIKQTKSKVLDLAIRGKLVSQDINDEPITIKNLKTKTSDIFPYPLPKNWVWCNLNDICTQITDGTHRTPKYTEIGIPFLRVTDITESNSSKKFISEEEHKELIKRCKPEKEDVLLSKNGTIGITRVVDWDYAFSIFVSLCLLKPKSIILNSKYLSFYLGSNEALKQMKSRSKAVGVTNLHLEEIRYLQIALPPLAEQKRIVSKIEQIFAQLDEIGKSITN